MKSRLGLAMFLINNQHFGYLQCLQHRALHPDDPLPELSPLVTSYLTPPTTLLTAAQPVMERVKKCFKLEVTEKNKDGQTGETMFKQRLDVCCIMDIV